MSENYFVSGIPISNKSKVFSVIIGFILMVINHNLSIISGQFDYPNRDLVSLIILFCIVVISIGSITSESIIIGIALFCVMSSIWDIGVLDITELRFRVIVGGVAILIFSTIFGKVSLFRIFKGQLGVK